MHMSDALVSAPVAIGAGLAAATLLVVAGKQVAKKNDSSLTPLMGVLGAFVFAAQMINFSIPGTGSSGHIVGGILLASILGPWAAFLTLVSVLIVQCLVFADGGLMALGCNIINMAAFSCLVGYPLVFRPLIKTDPSFGRISFAAIAASVVSLELGAVGVTAETELSGITALPTVEFLMFMTPIHLAIGICEGVATAGILYFVNRYRPALLQCNKKSVHTSSRKTRTALIAFAIGALLLGGCFSFIASSSPDGLEWSIAKVNNGNTELPIRSKVIAGADAVHNKVAIMPDYESPLSGIVGTILTISLLWSLSSIIVSRRKARRSIDK